MQSGLTLILLVIFSLVLTFTSIPESVEIPVLIIITAISILIGSSLSTIKLNKNGILNGGAVGLIYIAILYILSTIVTGTFVLNMAGIILVICSCVAGMLGGIIGVNMK